MDDYCNQGKDDNSDIQNRALGVRYNWCANKPCMCALDHYNIIFLLKYSSVYSLSWLQQVFYYGCSHVLEKFVRISGVYVHTGIRRSKQLVLTEELLMASWIVNNNKKKFLFFIIKLMQYKDTSQQAFLIIYLICIWSFIYFSLGRSRWVSHLKSRSAHKSVGTPDLD